MKVLHITSWYPNKKNPKEALWIERHIKALGASVEAYFVLHINVKPSKRFYKYCREVEGSFKEVIIGLPTQKWILIELITFLILVYQLLKLNVNRHFDVINCHIAYPLLTYWHILKGWIKIPLVITEHWSAYHFHFGVDRKEKLTRIKRIFRQRLPIICVSQSLRKDIQVFSSSLSAQTFVIPNTVDPSLFRHPVRNKKCAEASAFFMVSNWKWPKRPDITIKAFAKFCRGKSQKYNLRIGGYGDLLPDMEKLVADLGVTDEVKFLGGLEEAAIAEEMQSAIGFVHCSEYETFSVVCAEALCTGCPVIASEVGGIAELINVGNGILVKGNNVEAWETALSEFLNLSFSSKNIATEAAEKFSSQTVGERYHRVLQGLVNGNKE